jgi:hypothetical protein
MLKWNADDADETQIIADTKKEIRVISCRLAGMPPNP